MLIKLWGFCKNSKQTNSETVTNNHGKEIPKEIFKERYVTPEKRQKIIGDLILIQEYNNGISKNCRSNWQIDW